MKRFDDWDKRLSNYIASKANEPFSWGNNDCVLFAVKAAECLTGVNTYNSYLGYSTEEEAKEIIRSGGGLSNILSKHYGSGHRKYLKARRGDIVLIKSDDYQVGIIDDSGQFVILPSDTGLVREPLHKIWRVWSY